MASRTEDERKSGSSQDEPLPTPHGLTQAQAPWRRQHMAPALQIPHTPADHAFNGEDCVATPPFMPSAQHHDFFSVLQSSGDEEELEVDDEFESEDDVSLASELAAADPRPSPAHSQQPHLTPEARSNFASRQSSLNVSDAESAMQGRSRQTSRLGSRSTSQRLSRRGSFSRQPRGKYNPPGFDPQAVEPQWNLLALGRDTGLPLYRLEDVPKWQRYNIYIRGGYRAYYTFKQAFKSLFGWHNETINVWTHFLSFIIFIVFACMLYATVLVSVPQDTSLASSRLVYAFFLFGCLACTFNSSVYHLFNCHGSHRIMMLMGRLDFLGITVLIVASIIPPLYVLFHCQPYVRAFYITLMLTMGLAGVIGPWTHAFYEHAGVRVSIYLAMGFSGVIPCVHMVVVFPVVHLQSTIIGLMLMGFLYVTGVFFYMKQFPESMFPGKFDRFLSSHQLWHFFVSCAAFVHYFNCVSIYQMASISYGAC